jgi:RNA polymerase primary sigma factor
LKRNGSPSLGRDALGQYLSDIRKMPGILSRQEEKDLADRIQKGDRDALHTLVESNLRFVVKIAKRYRGYSIPIQDLINEGNLGLIEAAKRFDPSREVRFISYAIWWIRQMIISAVASMGHPFRLPIKVNNLMYRINITAAKEKEKNQRPSTSQELADLLKLKLMDVESASRLSGKLMSLSAPLTDDSKLQLEQVISQRNEISVEDRMVRDSIRNLLEVALGQLSKREEMVLRLRFGFRGGNSWKLREIGEFIGVSRERVRQIQEQALKRLRHCCKSMSLSDSQRFLAAF